MTYVSTRRGLRATSAETIFQGLAPDGGLYLPSTVERVGGIECADTLRKAEELVLEALFDDLPESVRREAVDRLAARFPSRAGACKRRAARQSPPVPAAKTPASARAPLHCW